MDILKPKGIAFQILMLLGLALFCMTVLFIAALWLLRGPPPSDASATIALKQNTVVAELNRLPNGERQPFLEKVKSEDPELDISLLADDEMPAGPARRLPPDWPFRTGEIGFGIQLVAAIPGEMVDGRPGPPELYFRLADGALVKTIASKRRGPPKPFRDLMIFLAGFWLLSFGLLLFWAMRRIIQPLENLSRSASTFGLKSVDPVPVAETGPAEVQEAARAFNRMQSRTNQFVERRTRMLAAISHDLRTPLTRLRLRLELTGDDEMKERNLADLTLMETQLQSALNFLKDGRTSEQKSKIDIASFLQSLSDQYEDAGHMIGVTCPVGQQAFARPVELSRAVSNLIDNALRYAGGASLEANVAGDGIYIDVIDQGPGIPEEDRERLLEPFERGDAARQVEEGTGFGLGLATSKGIVENQGGSLLLLETKGGGLTARIVLPRN